tara:strand:+ start:104 stop:700 length:597 start_codon:yes stop_codon:yes gene_type:complete
VPREFENQDEILTWADSLDERWPERIEVRAGIVDVVRSLRCSQATIVELCSGDGRLARQILQTVPDARYIGIDASESLCVYVRQQLGIETVRADLRESHWTSSFDTAIDAILTLQSMHDVGGPAMIEQLYASSLDALSAEGRLVAADFVVDEEAYDSEKAGRLPIAWHLDKLQSLGFGNVRCEIVAGKLACFVGERLP